MWFYVEAVVALASVYDTNVTIKEALVTGHKEHPDDGHREGYETKGRDPRHEH